MSIRAALGLLGIWCVVTANSLADTAAEVAWQVTGRGGFTAPNMLVDRAIGKPTALVIGEGDIGVVSFDLDGKRLWEYPMASPVTAVPAVGDLDGDGTEEIVAADAKGNLTALNSEHKPIWTARLPGAVRADSAPAIADLFGDGKVEVLVGDAAGILSCFDHAGKLLWQFSGEGTQMGPALVADIYDLPGKEIIVTSHDRHIYALSARGEWLWDLYCFDDLFPNSTPVLADVDGDGIPELYVGGGLNHFYRIDLATHRITLEENVYMHINGAIQAADLDGDGKDEIVFCTKGGAVRSYGKDGLRWKRDLPSASVLAAPSIVNLGTEPAPKILIHAKPGNVYALNADGSELFTAKMPASPSAAPLVGDLHGTGVLEMVVSSPSGMDGNATMACLRTNIPYHDNAQNRIMFGQDRAHTGRAVGAKNYAPLKMATPPAATTPNDVSAAPVGEPALLSGPNTWRFDVTNPRQIRAALLTELTAPDGSQRRYIRHIRSAKERAVVSFDVHSSGAYAVRQRIVDADISGVLNAAEKTLSFNGLDSDAEYLTREVVDKVAGSINGWKQTNPEAAASAQAQLTALKGMLTELRGGKPDTAQVAELRRASERMRALTEAGSSLAPKGSFFAWQFNPWAYFERRETLPAPANRTEQLDPTVCIGEYKSLALNITNVIGRGLEIRAIASDWTGPEPALAAQHVEFRRAVSVSNTRRERVADALPKLDDGGLIHVATSESEQLWITINATGLKPGEYTGKITLRSIEPDPTEVVLPLRIKVNALELPRPHPLRFCLWATDGGDLGTDKPEVLKDLVEHGTTVFFGTAPKAACDANGALSAPLDFAKHDESVRRLAPHGMLLFMSPQGMVTGQPFLSAPWKKAFIEYLRAWVEHMMKLGMDYSQWALYPYDEPSSPYNETTLNLVEVAKVIREADPKILIYADPTSGTTMETVEMFKGLIDIWCPSAELLERLGPELVPVAKKAGKEVWFYDASGEAKTLSCLGLYRWRFWYAWNQGFTGAGWWVYAAHGEASRWDGPNPTGDFFATVYDGPRGPVSSKRWEVAREGIQDYELLYLLRKEIEEHERRGDTSPVVVAAKKTLEEAPKAMEKELLNAGRRLPLTPDSVPLYEKVSETLEQTRAAIVQQCLALKGASK
ncbi:MAG: PQQ-binding-like beta-propeller repeat protein [Candidatus Hydrogenedentes bacterium]|nr:PQQ-binding-like beta-propeller repeat protein [Candidatus Hydrogenedentota bacterium]